LIPGGLPARAGKAPITTKQANGRIQFNTSC
jgi:hypothetical protein